MVKSLKSYTFHFFNSSSLLCILIRRLPLLQNLKINPFPFSENFDFVLIPIYIFSPVSLAFVGVTVIYLDEKTEQSHPLSRESEYTSRNESIRDKLLLLCQPLWKTHNKKGSQSLWRIFLINFASSNFHLLEKYYDVSSESPV